MKSTAFTVLTVLTVACTACEPGGTAWETEVDYTKQFFEPNYDVKLSRTQVLYLPVYSNVLTSERARPTELAALSS